MRDEHYLTLKSIYVEKAKVLEGQIRSLVLLIIAIGGGVGTLIVNFSNYHSREIVLSLVMLGIFLLGFVVFIAVQLWISLEDIKKRW
ncbi:hypothetical protein [Persephonella sp.]